MKKLLLLVFCMMYITPTMANGKWYPTNNQSVDNVYVKQDKAKYDNDSLNTRKQKYEDLFNHRYYNQNYKTNHHQGDSSLHVYIGTNISYNVMSYNSEMSLPYTKFPESYWGAGAELGIKFSEKDNKLNFGFLVSYDYLWDKEIYTLDYPIAKIGFSSIGIGFDNYIEISKQDNKRTDLVLGVGIAQATENASIDIPSSYSFSGYHASESVKDNVFLLKLGVNTQMTENIDLYTSARFFIPEKDTGIDFVLSVQTGIKFNF